jgi:hypothetical protein
MADILEVAAPEVPVTAIRITLQDQNAHVAAFKAMQHAEEKVGKVLVQMTHTKITAMEAEEAERNKVFAQMVMEEDRVVC